MGEPRHPGILFRHGALLDGPKWFAGGPVEDVNKALLRGLGHDGNILPIVAHGQQLRRGHRVIVPQIMVDELVVPDQLSRPGVECQQ